MNMYLQPAHDSIQPAAAYPPIYVHPSVAHIDPMQSVAMHQLQLPRQLPQTQQHQSDNALEQLASNVRSATTTSASDRAKQIFVHAWSVAFSSLHNQLILDSIYEYPGLMRTIPPTARVMFPVRVFTIHTVAYAIIMASPT
jgi:hypothetical protein